VNCKVNGVYKNLRYRILTIGHQTYILDVGSSKWKIVFPFLFWMFPNPAYKVEDQEIVEKIKTPEVAQANTGGQGLLGGGIAILIANLLKPMTDFFDIQSSPFVNSMIVMITVILLLSFRFYINYISKKKLYQVVNLESLEKHGIWIRPKPIKHFFFITGMYLFFLAFTVLLFIAFIEFPNVMMFFITVLVLFLTLFISVITFMVGNTTVKFKGGKKTAV